MVEFLTILLNSGKLEGGTFLSDYIDNTVIEKYCEQYKYFEETFSSIMANICLKEKEKKYKSIMVTSCEEGVGKSFVAVNMAIFLASSSANVLYVEADLRKAYSLKGEQSSSEVGFSDFIMNKKDFTQILSKTKIKNLTVIASGKKVGESGQFFCQSKFDYFKNFADENFDYAIYDTPALMSSSEGYLLGSKVDATVLVAQIKKTPRTAIEGALQKLKEFEANVVGVVLNKVRNSK